jgi:hypothetical protein
MSYLCSREKSAGAFPAGNNFARNAMILIRSKTREAWRRELSQLGNDPTDHSQLEYFPLEDLKTIYIQEVYRAVSERGWSRPLKTTAEMLGISTRAVQRARDKKTNRNYTTNLSHN